MQEKFKLLLSIILLTCTIALADNFNSDNRAFNCESKNSFDCSRSCSNDRNSDCKDCDSCEPLRTGLHYRSQGANTARELVGWQWDINRPAFGCGYGAGYIAFEYTRSFRPCQLARSLFGRETWTFEGSLVANRTQGALVADNFGLSRNFQGSITFRPRIQNYIVDLGGYWGADLCCGGVYFRLHAPIVHTRWCLNTACNDCCEVACTTTCDPFTPCYNTSNNESCSTAIATGPDGLPVTSSICPSTFTNNPSICTIEEALGGVKPFGDKKAPWDSGRFCFGERKRTGLADIDLIFGYNWLNDNCYHFGAYVQAVLPTGTRQKNRFVFDPVVGNGGHFELGGGLSGHAVVWSCDNANLGIFFEGNITHMFKNKQCRLFDYCKNGYLSRYLLLKEFDVVPGTTTLQYTGNLVSAATFNNRRVNVSIDVKADFSVKLAYRWCGWGADLGYNIYGHTHERIKLSCKDRCEGTKVYGIKGTEPVCNFCYPTLRVEGESGATFSIFPNGAIISNCATARTTDCNNVFLTGGTPCGLPGSIGIANGTYNIIVNSNNNTQPNATIFQVVKTLGDTVNFSGPCETICLSPESNSFIPSNGINVPFNTSTIPFNDLLEEIRSTPGISISQAQPHPGLVSVRDLDLRSAEAPAALTHKVFGHLNYSWDNCCWGNPNIGIGGEAEFASRRFKNTNCRRSAVDQWGVWIKGSVSY